MNLSRSRFGNDWVKKKNSTLFLVIVQMFQAETIVIDQLILLIRDRMNFNWDETEEKKLEQRISTIENDCLSS